ncbi:PREDICTED: uncharacterized protein LOC109339679 [Lupinus angustifolius]|uniref:uncharacterized protein LOC109339679 n=1 Tax=Lupinus angustifolius TaxID=3871 RepID=UPI00092F36DE|nr:PREDICTED: uncharacterized protein LOC109339679 [Lupinus angustifolius]
MVNNVVPTMITDTDNSRLSSIPSHDEIKSVVFDMNGDGAPGPDGFGGSFYQAFWHRVGPDVCRATLQFFTQDYILPNLNSNNVVLIPKLIGADKIEDFRPIVMTNFQFKIISKVLADRLATIAPKIVSIQQRGFVKDRQINDCICLASEAINLLDHKVFGGNLAIKIDIKKAFNTIDWDFLLLTLQKLGFNYKFRNWIRIILHSARLSINVNGKMVGFFKCTRGVRQGDSLSPLLFCIAEDVLSRGLSKLMVEGKISTIEGPKGIKTPSHVLYVDDIFIFCKGIKKELLKINQLLNNYSEVSGQCANASKSKFYSTSSSHWNIASMAQVLGFSTGSLPLTYLGVPIFFGQPRRIHLQRIADKIINKLATWKWALLSIMGRIELVRKLVTVAWKNVCLSLKEGGLSIRSLKMINHAALLKLTWEMVNSNHEWAMFFRKRFGSNPTPSNRYFKSSICNDTWIIPQTLINNYPEIISKICSIIINSDTDKLVWKNSSDGLLSAKAAYLHMNPGSVQNNWGKVLWSAAIPPSKSFTTWRLLNNKMPTDDNLQRRVFVWNWLSYTLSTTLDISSITNLLKNQARFNNTLISFPIALSRIKLAISLSGNNSKACANNSITDFALLRHLHVQINYSKAPKIIEVIWLPPDQATVKINTDGAARGSPGYSAGGGIFRNHEGQTIACFACFNGCNDALFVELTAAILAIIFAHQKGWHNIWLECDSMIVVDIFYDKAIPPWKLLSKWNHCKKLLSSMNWVATHIYREGNTCADQLANFGLSIQNIEWWNHAPSFILDEVNRNRLNLPNSRFVS